MTRLKNPYSIAFVILMFLIAAAAVVLFTQPRTGLVTGDVGKGSGSNDISDGGELKSEGDCAEMEDDFEKVTAEGEGDAIGDAISDMGSDCDSKVTEKTKDQEEESSANEEDCVNVNWLEDLLGEISCNFTDGSLKNEGNCHIQSSCSATKKGDDGKYYDITCGEIAAGLAAHYHVNDNIPRLLELGCTKKPASLWKPFGPSVTGWTCKSKEQKIDITPYQCKPPPPGSTTTVSGGNTNAMDSQDQQK